MLLGILLFVALGLTIALFTARQPQLGWPAAIFWGLSGGQSYSLRTGTWDDMYFYIAFACLAGMFVFVPLAALGFRDKKDEDSIDLMDDRTISDEQREERRAEKSEEYDDGMSNLENSNKTSSASQRVRQRADSRRNKGRSRVRW